MVACSQTCRQPRYMTCVCVCGRDGFMLIESHQDGLKHIIISNLEKEVKERGGWELDGCSLAEG